MEAPRSVLKKISVSQQNEERRVSFAPLPTHVNKTIEQISRKRQKHRDKSFLNELQKNQSPTDGHAILNQHKSNKPNTNTQSGMFYTKQESSATKRSRNLDIMENVFELCSQQSELERNTNELASKVLEHFENTKMNGNILLKKIVRNIETSLKVVKAQETVSIIESAEFLDPLKQKNNDAAESLEEVARMGSASRNVREAFSHLMKNAYHQFSNDVDDEEFLKSCGEACATSPLSEIIDGIENILIKA